MCEIREAVGAYAAGFDPALVSAAEAQRIVEEAVAAENMLATVRGLAARRVSQTELWRREGDRSPAHHPRVSGSSVTKAQESLDTAARLASLPQVAAAARRGELSPAQAAPIADAASKAPAAEERLLAAAKALPLGGLRDSCARTKAAAEPDDDARHKAIHRSRFLRRRRSADGAGELHYRSTPEEVAEIFGVVKGWAERRFKAARAAGRHEPNEAYLADGLLDAVRASQVPTGRGPAAGGAAAGGTGPGGTGPGGAGGGGGPAGGVVDGGATGGCGSTGGGADRSASDQGAGDATGGGGEEASEQQVGGSGGGPCEPASDPGADDETAADEGSPTGSPPDEAANELFPDAIPAPASPPATPAPLATDEAGPSRPPSPLKVIVRIDFDTLVRGFPLDGELCEVAGLGPVPVAAVRAMMSTGNAFLAAVVTKGVDVVGVAHLGRRPTAHQQTALQWTSPQCTNTACDAVFGLENDHRQPWSESKVTLVGCMDPLCRHCHHLKTYQGWALVEGAGRRPLVPPEDPRHPANG